MEPAKTLEQILKESEKGDTQGVLKALIEHLKTQEDDKLNRFQDVLEGIISSQKNLSESMLRVVNTLEKILNRPDPVFPEPKEFPSTMKVEMDKPDWYKEPSMTTDVPDLKRPILSLQKALVAEMQKIQLKLQDLSEKETIEEKPAAEPLKTVNTGAVRSRRTTQWKIATYPQVPGTLALVATGDGVTYYLPSACISNSETGRLNGGAPLSHGVDYTITGNKIVFVQDQTNSQQEWRYQTR